jgi:hypothetical protein
MPVPVPAARENAPVDPVQRLYAVPLEDFVAERRQVAKDLRAAGDKDRAAELAKLPKPTPAAWALNALARERPDVVGAWVEVADALRAASANPGPGLREAMAAHREATTQLVALVRAEVQPGGKPLSEPMLDRVRALLQEATVDAERAARLRSGLVVEGEARDGAAPPPAPQARTAAAPAGGDGAVEAAAAAERRAREQAERAAEARREELARSAGEAAERAGRLRDEAADRAHAAAEAAERLEDARRALLRTESEAEAAQQAADEARDAAADAARKAEVLATQLREAGG